MLSCTCSEVSIAQEKSFLYFVGHNSAIKVQYAIGLCYKGTTLSVLLQIFCVLDSFLKGHSLMISQHRLLHSIITSLMWNSEFACAEIHCNSL